jgi:transmembrane sensor
MRRFTVTTQATDSSNTDLPEPIRAEAAVWLARLHSDMRSADTERGFRAWFAADPLHAAAFERMTNTWEATRSLTAGSAPQSWRGSFERVPRLRVAIAAAASLIAVLCAGAWFLTRTTPPTPLQVVETDLGERRSRLLPDGSRVVLNTDSRVSFSFQPTERRLVLEKGQARFDVAHAPGRPFVVYAGGKWIAATGTAFDVRWTDARLSVVLFEGQVTVGKSGKRAPAKLVTLEAGERAQFDDNAVIIRSVHELSREEAWLDGRAVFENTHLRDAIAEMNRYTHRPLELADPAIGDWTISGTFSVDDVDAFARSLVDLFPLSIELTDERILLRAD